MKPSVPIAQSSAIDQQRQAVVARLGREQTSLAEREATLPELALACAIEGGRKERDAFADAYRRTAQCRTEIELLTLAAQALDRQLAAAESAAEIERATESERRRQAQIDAEYRRRRPQIEATIERFTRECDTGQVVVWRGALRDLRQTIEAEMRRSSFSSTEYQHGEVRKKG